MPFPRQNVSDAVISLLYKLPLVLINGPTSDGISPQLLKVIASESLTFDINLLDKSH